MKNRKTSIDCAFMQRADVLRRAAMAQLKGGTAKNAFPRQESEQQIETNQPGCFTKPTKKGAAKIIQHTVISNTHGFGIS